MNVVLRLTEAAIEFLWVVGGVAKSFRVQPNNCVEVVLHCVVVGVVTMRPPQPNLPEGSLLKV